MCIKGEMCSHVRGPEVWLLEGRGLPIRIQNGENRGSYLSSESWGGGQNDAKSHFKLAATNDDQQRR